MNSCKLCNKETTNKVFCSVGCSSKWNNANAMTLETRKKQGRKNSTGTKIPKNIMDVSSRTVSKILSRLNVGCSNCGWNESSCDLHHIIPKSKNGSNSHDNLTLLCPNCHRLAHTEKLDVFINLNEHIGDSWREHYLAHG